MPSISVDSMRIDEIEQSLEKNPTQTALWLRYAKHWENTDEVNALAVYNDAVRRCPHVELWRQYIEYCKRCVTVKGVVAVMHAAIDVISHDHRCGDLFQEYIALLKAVWNYQYKYRDELILDDYDPALLLGDPDADAAKLAEEETELANKCGGHIPLTHDEDESIKWIAKKAPSDSYISVKTRLSLEHIRRLSRQACTSPSSCVDKIVKAYETFEDKLIGHKHSLSNTMDREGVVKEFYHKITNAKNVYQKLEKLYQNVDTLTIPQPEVSVLSKTPSKSTNQLLKWAELLSNCEQIVQFERGNPLKLEVADYQTRVIFLYQNMLLITSCFADFWYSFYQFLYTFSPVKALQVLKIACEKLPNDLFLRLSYITNFEELIYKKHFNATLLGDVMNSQASTSGSLHEAIFDIENSPEYATLLKDMDLVLQKTAKQKNNPDDPDKIEFDFDEEDPEIEIPHTSKFRQGSSKEQKYKLVFTLYEKLLQEPFFEGEQYALVIIHFLNFIRRQAGPDQWRDYLLKKVFINNHQKLTWEVYASQALVEYHCFGERDRCAQIYKIALDRFRTVETFEPSLVASFVNFLISVNDLAAARDELTLAMQKCYKLLREIQHKSDNRNQKDKRVQTEKQKLGQGFKFLFEKLIRLQQSYGDDQDSFTKILQQKNQFLLESVPDVALVQAESLVGDHILSDAHEDAAINAFLNDTLTTMLHVSGDPTDPAAAFEDEFQQFQQQQQQQQQGGKKGRGKRQKGKTLSHYDMRDAFHSDKIIHTYHLDQDYNRPNFLRANLLSSILQPGANSFFSCSSVLPFAEAQSRFKFQHLTPNTNKLNPVASKNFDKYKKATDAQEEKEKEKEKQEQRNNRGRNRNNKHNDRNNNNQGAGGGGLLTVGQVRSKSGSFAEDAENSKEVVSSKAAAKTTAAGNKTTGNNLLNKEGSAASGAEGEQDQDQIALMVKQRMLAQFEDSDDDLMQGINFRDEEVDVNTATKKKPAAAPKNRVTRPDTARMHAFNPMNAVQIASAGQNLGQVSNILPKVLLDLQQMLPKHKQVLKGSAPDVDYIMSVLQTVEVPELPLDQFCKAQPDPGSGLGGRSKDAGFMGGLGGGLFGGAGARVTSLDENTGMMHAVGGSVHNFLIEGAVDESRYRIRGAGTGQSAALREPRRVKKAPGGAKKEEPGESDHEANAEMSAMRERLNVKRRKVQDIVKAEIGA
ncbi:unnamed protein product [Amoebophrya sp. A120]|nr:unnamed protein product [Amoebophrya sp. A120]|eukprot:GSA120T00024624001.1